MIRETYTCSILDKEFYKKYGIDIGDDNIDKKPGKIKKNAVVPAESSIIVDESEEKKNVNPIDEEQKPYKRVTVKAIEFDWIFNSEEGNKFLANLSETDNINIFGYDIIKDIILFQWSHFKSTIIYKLFIPYLFYFLIFILFSTWIIHRKHHENDENNTFHILSWLFGGTCLLFN